MVEILQVLQFFGGALLFAFTGYYLVEAFFKKGELDAIEKVVFALSFAMVLPALLLLFASMVFSIKIDAFVVYAVFIAVGGGAYYYAKNVKKD